MAKNILGLDLGTNSIGWALIEIDHENEIVKIIGLGSRILPMDAGEIGDFESGGKIKSSAAARTEKRGSRRLNERYILRRDRLHLVLNLLDALPEHYKLEIDFERKGEKCGQFKTNKEPKLAYTHTSLPITFIFENSYEEMLKDMGIENRKGNRIPKDWTLYYLRQKALSKEITLEELAWVLLSYNQKRGYEKLDVEDSSTKENEIVEELDLQVRNVSLKVDEKGINYFEVQLDGNDNFIYREYSQVPMTEVGDLKEIIKTSEVNNDGEITKTEFTVVDIYPLIIKNVGYKNEDGKHKYTLSYQTGWTELKESKNYTFRYKNVIDKSYDYIVETNYSANGKIKSSLGKDRRLREPDFGDKSKDWTLLKKRTEKEALKFNINQGYKNPDGSAKNLISPKMYRVLKTDAATGNRTKLIGGIFQVVERKFYREELKEIVATQRKYHDKLNDLILFERCVKILYPKNDSHANNLLSNKDALEHLLIEDILLYQRPLKTKKSEISNCKYEVRYKEAVDKSTGELINESVPLKVVSASHPYFQEFRIWDKLHNLRLIQLEKEINGKLSTNVDVTKDYFNEKRYQTLFDTLNNQKTLTQKQFLLFCKSEFKIKDIENFVWNFPEDEELKGNETRVSFATRFKRCGFSQYANFLTQNREIELWHYLYSVNHKERKENDSKSIKTFFNRFLDKNSMSADVKSKIIEDFTNYPKFVSKYCAYSEKALKKLLPFLRMGDNLFAGKFDLLEYKTDLDNLKYDKFRISSYCVGGNSEFKKQCLYEALWKHSVNERIDKILNRLKKINFKAEEIDYTLAVINSNDLKQGELPFPKGLFNAFREFEIVQDFTSLDLTRSSYLVYGRHSELAEAKYWTSPKQIRDELHKELKQHSLNSPVAEKVILEMMQVVADIWDYYGEGAEKFFTEIHVEVGRELKKSAKEKEVVTTSQNENRKQNARLRALLEEFLSSDIYKARPKNADHFDRLKIVEDSARNQLHKKGYFDNKNYSKKDIEAILKKPRLQKQDFEKYKLWIEQGYKSPYTNRMINLTDLFDGTKYNIDHIFPQASITNDSSSNKVVCEIEVNKLKSDQTGRDFVNNPKQRTVFCIAHKTKDNLKGEIPIIDDHTYTNLVNAQFTGTKRHILLSKEIPKGFINGQLNNARHIARKAMELLSHIVRENGEMEFLSKNVLPVTGAVTGKLKEAWRLDEVWKELVAPRYIRMNQLTNSKLFGQEQVSKSGSKYFDCNVDENIREKDESYDIKRIDHRHHALDALIIALCTRDHVNYINNINADARSGDYGKQKQIEAYRTTLKKKIKFTSKRENDQDDRNWHYMLPGKIRQTSGNYSEDTVASKSYFYKAISFNDDYKKMILTALLHTVVTFKQNLRVINKTVNRYNNGSNKKKLATQTTQSGEKYNWAIRRSLGKATFYGKVNMNGELKVVGREHLDISFNTKVIKTITDTGIQKILKNHLMLFDTVALPFEEGINYYEALLEKEEFEGIVKNDENKFKNIEIFISYLKENNYKFKKADYKNLNVFVNKLTIRNLRVEAKNNKEYTITEHPEIAFTPEMIEEMNKPENIRQLNINDKGEKKNHTPIKKVRISKGFGKKRPISKDESSVKSKQYVITDAGSNLYLGFYEKVFTDEVGSKIKERKFKDIGLLELIEVLKEDKNSRHNPIDAKVFDKDEEYNRIFTLSPLDLVYLPTPEEIEAPSSVDFKHLTAEQLDRVYKYVDGGGGIANFIPYSVSKAIWKFHDDKKKIEIYKELSEKGVLDIPETELIKDEFGFGSQQTKNQNMIDGKTQIKKICWKLEVDRLGNLKQKHRIIPTKIDL